MPNCRKIDSIEMGTESMESMLEILQNLCIMYSILSVESNETMGPMEAS